MGMCLEIRSVKGTSLRLEGGQIDIRPTETWSGKEDSGGKKLLHKAVSNVNFLP